MENHHNHPSERISPSSVYYCPMECEGEKVYFVPGKRCPVCNMFLVPIEEREDYKNKPATFSKTNLPENFRDKVGEYFCPMFCESDKTYDSDTGCPVCHMHLEEITEDLIKNASHQGKSPKPSTDAPVHTDSQAGKYYCPMFCEGDRVYDSNVGCPVCGMDLVQIPSKDNDGEDETFNILKKKFIIALVFTVPVFILSMGGMFFTFPFSHQIQGILELVLTLPVLFYAGWFLMKRGWVSFKTWNLNMFSLIALGVAAAFLFSITALFFPDIFPHEMVHDGKVPLYFEAVSVILNCIKPKKAINGTSALRRTLASMLKRVWCIHWSPPQPTSAMSPRPMPCCMEKNGLAWVMPATKALRSGRRTRGARFNGKSPCVRASARPCRIRRMDGCKSASNRSRPASGPRLNIRSGSSRTSLA